MADTTIQESTFTTEITENEASVAGMQVEDKPQKANFMENHPHLTRLIVMLAGLVGVTVARYFADVYNESKNQSTNQLESTQSTVSSYQDYQTSTNTYVNPYGSLGTQELGKYPSSMIIDEPSIEVEFTNSEAKLASFCQFIQSYIDEDGNKYTVKSLYIVKNNVYFIFQYANDEDIPTEFDETMMDERLAATAAKLVEVTEFEPTEIYFDFSDSNGNIIKSFAYNSSVE